MKRFSFFFGLTLAIALLFGTAAYAQVTPDSTGLNKTAAAAGLLEVSPSDVPTLIGNVLGTALSMIGVLFFLLMLYGGVLWMTARGEEDQTKKAMNTIIAASIGIVIVLASYALTNFVFKSVNEQSTAPVASPAGGGAPQVASCNPNKQGWSCKSINDGSCGVITPGQVLPPGELALGIARGTCGEQPESCMLNRCPDDPSDVVCCAP